MRHKETVKVGEETYEIIQLGALSGRGFFLRITKSIGPKLVRLIASAANDMGKFLDDDKTVEELASLLAELDDQLFVDLCNAFAEHSSVLVKDGTTERWPGLGKNFDEHFAGKYFGMLKWFGECLRVNGADFLAEAQPMIQSLRAKAYGQRQSRSKSTGSSGGS